jgi:hypothetical protein
MKISTGIPIFNTPVDPQGTENQPPNAIFHAGSKNLMSHIIDVSETAIIVKAYGFLNDASTITVCTVTTERDGKNYASPMVLNGRHVQLSNRNNVLVIDMTGKYTFQLSDGLGVTTCAYHESGLGLWSFGLSAFAVANGMLEFVDTESTHIEMVENQVKIYAKISNDTTNLIRLRNSNTIPDDPFNDKFGPEGLYYGPSAVKWQQYVSSSTGNDANDGISPATPLKTIQQAIRNLPDQTIGIIYLYAGDTFPTIPTALTDVVSGTYTTQAALNLSSDLNIGDRQITFVPYNDPCIDAITNWNNTHGTNYVPYLANEINFPTVKITLVLPTDSAAYVPVGYTVGSNGVIAYRGVKIDVSQTGTVNPAYLIGAYGGYGKMILEGGSTKLGSVPLLLTPYNTFTFSESFHTMSDHTVVTPGTGPLFCKPATQYFINTVDPSAGGGTIVVGLPYTYHADNCQSYLEPLSMWPGLTLYPGTPVNVVGGGGGTVTIPGNVVRSYKKVITSIYIH